MTTTTKAEIRDDYLVKIKTGSGMSMSELKVRDTLNCDIVFIDESGKETHALHIDSYFAGRTEADNKRIVKRMRAKANIQLGRLRAYREREGRRWEVVKEEECRAKREADRLEARKKQAIRDAGPALLAALKMVQTRAQGLTAEEWEQVTAAITSAETIPAAAAA